MGWQPTTARPGGQRTSTGYADDVAAAERSRWSDLRLVELGCPGETTATMLNGGSLCPYRSGSPRAAATSFLHRHPSTVLITVDLEAGRSGPLEAAPRGRSGRCGASH